MAGGSDVSAGNAFVRLFLKDDMTKALQKSLKSAGTSVTAFGQGVTKLGVGISAIGAGMLAPIVGGVKAFMSMGGAAVDAAARTGLSVEALSELGYAAEQTGTDMGAVEAAIKRMAKSGLARTGESAEAAFMRVGAAIAAIQDPMKRAAKAQEIFGKAGTMLLPMLSDMEALRAKARELGIVMSTEDANAADDLGDAWDSLKSQGKTIFFQIGAAVAGPLKEFATRTSAIAKKVIDWAKANRPLIATFAKVAVGVALAGAVITTLGGIVVAAGMALTGLATVIGAIGSVIGMIVSPIGLIAAGITIAAIAFLRFTEAGKGITASFASSFSGLLDLVRSVFGGITDALKSGEFALAGQIAMTGLQLAVVKVLSLLTKAFGDTFGSIASDIMQGDFSGAWKTVLLSLGAMWEAFATGVVETFSGAAVLVTEAWARAATSITKTLLDLSETSGLVGDVMSLVLGIDMREVEKQREKLNAQAAKMGMPTSGTALDEAKSAGAAQISATEQGIKDRIAAAAKAAREAIGTASGDELAKRTAGVGGELDAQGAALQAELDRLKAEAAAAAAAGALPVGAPGAGIPGEGGMGGAGAIQSGIATYSAAAASAAGQMGGGGPMDKMVEGVVGMRKTMEIMGKGFDEVKVMQQKLVDTLGGYIASFVYQ